MGNIQHNSRKWKWHTGVILCFFWHMCTVTSSDFIIYLSSNLELRDVEVCFNMTAYLVIESEALNV